MPHSPTPHHSMQSTSFLTFNLSASPSTASHYPAPTGITQQGIILSHPDHFSTPSISATHNTILHHLTLIPAISHQPSPPHHTPLSHSIADHSEPSPIAHIQPTSHHTTWERTERERAGDDKGTRN